MDKARRRILLVLLVAGIVAGGYAWLRWRAGRLPPYEPPSVRHDVPAVDGELRIVAMGDWGSRKRPQADVLEAIDRLAGARGGIHGGLLLGDNFYPRGVKSVEDDTWVDVFEHPFDKPWIAKVPWYPVLGNHDYGGNVRAQVEYSARSNGRWVMPQEFYRLDLPSAEAPLVTILALDTNHETARWAEEMTWLENELQALADAPQIVLALGHHPIASYADAPDRVEVQMRRDVDPLFQRTGAVDLYLCGHSHCMELIRAGRQLEAVIGSGGKDLYAVVDGEGTLFSRSTYGFGLLTITPGRLRLEFVATDGAVLFTHEQTRREGR